MPQVHFATRAALCSTLQTPVSVGVFAAHTLTAQGWNSTQLGLHPVAGVVRVQQGTHAILYNTNKSSRGTKTHLALQGSHQAGQSILINLSASSAQDVLHVGGGGGVVATNDQQQVCGDVLHDSVGEGGGAVQGGAPNTSCGSAKFRPHSLRLQCSRTNGRLNYQKQFKPRGSH